jgi:hypothetical protein
MKLGLGKGDRCAKRMKTVTRSILIGIFAVVASVASGAMPQINVAVLN